MALALSRSHHREVNRRKDKASGVVRHATPTLGRSEVRLATHFSCRSLGLGCQCFHQGSMLKESTSSLDSRDVNEAMGGPEIPTRFGRLDVRSPAMLQDLCCSLCFCTRHTMRPTGSHQPRGAFRTDVESVSGLRTLC